MPLYEIDGMSPQYDDRDSNWVAPDAVLIGDVRIGRNAGIWFGAVIRGDNEPISIGERNIEGLKVTGSRLEFTIDSGKVGNEQPITVLRREVAQHEGVVVEDRAVHGPGCRTTLGRDDGIRLAKRDQIPMQA